MKSIEIHKVNRCYQVFKKINLRDRESNLSRDILFINSGGKINLQLVSISVNDADMRTANYIDCGIL